jgi:hypothetical protein
MPANYLKVMGKKLGEKSTINEMQTPPKVNLEKIFEEI